ncbi:MAG: sigma-70 family RNA polymerase sigma factor [Ilumatobacteraceae bacterium]|nr:sigma-70 family RNA polymerase sigma factor [Ilumatobacteraceae bacterium]
MTDVAEAIAAVHRSDWGRIVAGLIRRTGDWTLAEDATQDAFAAAFERWPKDGIPDRPAAWLTTTARNRAIDRLRSAKAERSRLGQLSMEVGPSESNDIDDDRLRLIFTCCHPALPLAARVALTLRTVAGLSVAEIARAFLVSETTMAQRLVRARGKIDHAGIPYRIPPAELLEERLNGVLAVLYLAFNAGYSDVALSDVAGSAISLAEAVVDLMPLESEARGLLALMLMQNSRRDARVDSGELLTLEEQDRSRWDRSEIERGCAILRSARHRGPYVLQASIAQCHAVAESAVSTDWSRIVALYDELLSLSPSPVIELNRAIAVGMRDGSDAGLALIDDVSGQLPGFHLVPAAQADLLRRAGRVSDAEVRYLEAIALAPTAEERAQLQRRLVGKGVAGTTAG